MKQLLRGRSGRKNNAQATLKKSFKPFETFGSKVSGWKPSRTKTNTDISKNSK
jgi:hypothetical protein